MFYVPKDEIYKTSVKEIFWKWVGELQQPWELGQSHLD